MRTDRTSHAHTYTHRQRVHCRRRWLTHRAQAFPRIIVGLAPMYIYLYSYTIYIYIYIQNICGDVGVYSVFSSSFKSMTIWYADMMTTKTRIVSSIYIIERHIPRRDVARIAVRCAARRPRRSRARGCCGDKFQLSRASSRGGLTAIYGSTMSVYTIHYNYI